MYSHPCLNITKCEPEQEGLLFDELVQHLVLVQHVDPSAGLMSLYSHQQPKIQYIVHQKTTTI